MKFVYKRNKNSKRALEKAKALAGFITIFGVSLCYGQEINKSYLYKLNPLHAIQVRGPGSFVPNEEIIVAPYQYKSWAEKAFAEDKKGVMVSIRNQVQEWQSEDEYAKNWNLDNTGLYEQVEQDTKVKYLRRQSLKYLDKRISGEIKEAEEGSTLATVGQVQEALKPSSKVDISPNLRLRIKARVLEGKAFVKLENPYIDSQTEVKANGEVQMYFGKDIKALGIKSDVNYLVNDSNYIASIRRPLTERLEAQISSEQKDDKMAFSSESDRKVQLNFFTPF